MKRLALAVPAALAFAALGLWASKPAAADLPQLTVTKVVTIAAAPAKVWGIIQNFSDLTWFSAVKSSDATDGNNPGSVRTLNLSGPIFHEQLDAYDADGMSYSYHATDDPNNVKVVPVTDYHSTLSVKATDDGNGSVVTWTSTFNRASPSAHPPADMDDAAAKKAIAGIYDGALADLKKAAEGS
ncbi:MAG: SRPBCC family protein [Vulcanimicrobiaceae bacterium]